MSDKQERPIPPPEQKSEKMDAQHERSTEQKPVDQEQLQTSEEYAEELVASLSETALRAFEKLKDEAVSEDIDEAEIQQFLSEFEDAQKNLHTALEIYTEELKTLNKQIIASKELMADLGIEDEEESAALETKASAVEQKTEKIKRSIEKTRSIGSKAKETLIVQKENTQKREQEAATKTQYIQQFKKSGLDIKIIVNSITKLDKNGKIDTELQKLNADLNLAQEKLSVEGKQALAELTQKYGIKREIIAQKIESLIADFTESATLAEQRAKAEKIKDVQPQIYEKALAKIEKKRQEEIDAYIAEQGLELQRQVAELDASEETERFDLLKSQLGESLAEKSLTDIPLDQLNKEIAQHIDPLSKNLDYELIQNLPEELIQEIVNNLDIGQITEIAQRKLDLRHSVYFIRKKERVVQTVINSIRNGDFKKDIRSLTDRNITIRQAESTSEEDTNHVAEDTWKLKSEIIDADTLIGYIFLTKGMSISKYKNTDVSGISNDLDQLRQRFYQRGDENYSFSGNPIDQYTLTNSENSLKNTINRDWEESQKKQEEFKKQVFEAKEKEAKKLAEQKEKAKDRERQNWLLESAKKTLMSSKSTIERIREEFGHIDLRSPENSTEMLKLYNEISTQSQQLTYIESNTNEDLSQSGLTLDAETKTIYKELIDLKNLMSNSLSSLRESMKDRVKEEEQQKKTRLEEERKLEKRKSLEEEQIKYRTQQLEQQRKKALVDLKSDLSHLQRLDRSRGVVEEQIQTKQKLLQEYNDTKPTGLLKRKYTLRTPDGEIFDASKDEWVAAKMQITKEISRLTTEKEKIKNAAKDSIELIDLQKLDALYNEELPKKHLQYAGDDARAIQEYGAAKESFKTLSESFNN